MKRPSRKRRLHSVIVTRKRTKRRSTRLRRRASTLAKYARKTAVFQWLRAPEIFGIDTPQSRHPLIRFLSDLRSLGAKEGSNVRIDFHATKKMTAPGTLLFAAELGRVCELPGRRRLSCNYPLDDVVAQVLQHVGIFNMLSQKRQCAITAANVKYWRVDSGQAADGRKASAAIAGYKHLFPDPEQKKMYRALTEAMTNCRQHAYTEERGDGLRTVPSWWMFSQLSQDRLVVVFCDLGIGIPRSLSRNESGFWKDVLRLLRDLNLADNDGHRIQAAMEVGASRTRDKHRGKGLMDMRSVVDGLQGTLLIHSNCGAYLYDAASRREKCSTYKTAASIQGTLIQWSIPVQASASGAV